MATRRNHGSWHKAVLTCPFFLHESRRYVQVLHKPPCSSEERVTIQVAAQEKPSTQNTHNKHNQTSSVDMSSGLTLFPFADAPHIRQEGFILHGFNRETRVKVHRLLLQREIASDVGNDFKDHPTWIHDEGSPVQVFNFNSLVHLVYRPVSPPTKRRAAMWLSP